MIFKNKGLTVLEILLVAVIIAITASISIIHHRKTLQRARIKEAEAQLELIYDAEKFYYLNRNRYTSSLNDLGLYIPESPYFSYSINVGGGSFTATVRYDGCVMSIDSSARTITKTGCSF